MVEEIKGSLSNEEQPAINGEAESLAPVPSSEKGDKDAKKKGLATDLPTVLKELKDFFPDIEKRLLMAHRNKFKRIVRDFENAIATYTQKFEQADVKTCLAAVRERKQFLPHHLLNEAAKYFKALFTYEELGALFYCPGSTVQEKLKTQTKREGREQEERSRSLGLPNLPASLRDISPEEITDEQAAHLAKWVLVRKLITTEDTDTAKNLINMFNQSVKSESLRKWQQLKRLIDFVLTRLLPALQKAITNAGINLDVKIIMKDVLSQGLDEMNRGIKEDFSESPELDELVKKAKRRGKFIKKEE